MEIIEMNHMNLKDDAFTMGLDRFNALLTWRGVPNPFLNGGFDETWQRYQAMASDIQKAYGEAIGHQTDLFVTAVGRLADSFPGILESRSPSDIAAAQLEVFSAFLKSASPLTKTWGEFVQKLDDCCAAFADETAQRLHKQSAGEPATGRPGKPAMQS
jgi:hypothetical protein